MKLIAQQILMNWIGIVAVLFDLFPINGNAEKLSVKPIVGPHPQLMSGPKVEDRPNNRFECRLRERTVRKS